MPAASERDGGLAVGGHAGRVPRPAAGPGQRRPALSPRQRQVARLLAEGRTTEGVARLLGVGAGTAAVHRRAIARKLGPGPLAELLRNARRRGLLGP